jgi:hypothetical protein
MNIDEMKEKIEKMSLKHGDVILVSCLGERSPNHLEIQSNMKTFDSIATFVKETRGINVFFWMVDSNSLKITVLSDSDAKDIYNGKKFRTIRLGDNAGI